MADAIEREIKLPYDSPGVARRAVVEAGATPLRARRLQNDCLLDRETEPLGDRHCTLRVRIDGDRAYVTFKGAPTLDTMKVRQEIETTVGDGKLLLRLFEQLGFRSGFAPRIPRGVPPGRPGDRCRRIPYRHYMSSSRVARRTSSPWPRRSNAPPRSSCSTRIWPSSSSIVRRRDRQRPICCSTDRDRCSPR